MIKKLIFDLDDTIFNTTKDACKAYEKFLNKYDFNCTSKELYDALDDVNYIDNCTYEDLYNFLKKFLGEKFTKNKFEEFEKLYINEVTLISDKAEETFKYLSSKYEIVALSNWFYKLQSGKLEVCGLLKYFSNIYTFDTIGQKPDVNVFKKSCEPYSFSECAVIGDSISCDILVPNKLGMKTFYLGESSDLVCIKDISDLITLL